jgi:spore germination protein GerM
VGEPTNSQNTQANGAPTAEEKILQVYWLKPTGNTIELAPLTLKLSASNNSQALLDAALNKLLAGPTDPSAVTTIPQGTSLRSVTIKQDGVHVDLSKEFTSGGGSTSMIGRLGQVIYTATSLNPNTPVWISVEGKSLKTLGGEGLVLEQPLTRDRYQKDFPR